MILLLAASPVVPRETNAGTIGLPITSQHDESHNFIYAYMRQYFIPYSDFLRVDMKLRGNEKARSAV